MYDTCVMGWWSVQNAMVQALQKQNRILNYLRYGEGPVRILLEFVGVSRNECCTWLGVRE